MSAEGHFDKDTRTVTLTMTGADKDDIAYVATWLRKVRDWIARQELREAGGRRWEFERFGSDLHTVWRAQYWEGANPVRWESYELRETVTRRSWHCRCCGRDVPAGSVMLIPKRGQYGGGKLKFCQPCIERGSKPVPPKLTVITGGL